MRPLSPEATTPGELVRAPTYAWWGTHTFAHTQKLLCFCYLWSCLAVSQDQSTGAQRSPTLPTNLLGQGLAGFLHSCCLPASSWKTFGVQSGGLRDTLTLRLPQALPHCSEAGVPYEDPPETGRAWGPWGLSSLPDSPLLNSISPQPMAAEPMPSPQGPLVSQDTHALPRASWKKCPKCPYKPPPHQATPMPTLGPGPGGSSLSCVQHGE